MLQDFLFQGVSAAVNILSDFFIIIPFFMTKVRRNMIYKSCESEIVVKEGFSIYPFAKESEFHAFYK